MNFPFIEMDEWLALALRAWAGPAMVFSPASATAQAAPCISCRRGALGQGGGFGSFGDGIWLTPGFHFIAFLRKYVQNYSDGKHQPHPIGVAECR
ncbi:hypothetical protein [Cupriavidus consociatus]|uniref:hypothetical protein n=1 Tax=Cupriavidus consociatus TaxID=2821357 RepID=UPI001AEA3B40|nr:MULTISPECIES: hypothetical protein [unclassified Cupriavidus]MBP0624835.1 hypothetical protein [Cupriavidus sp. LEh25]MDK2661562.1 hypothetical protein [Cupriavidus sp. LEh21]